MITAQTKGKKTTEKKKSSHTHAYTSTSAEKEKYTINEYNRKEAEGGREAHRSYILYLIR